jgi:hypothetical protein
VVFRNLDHYASPEPQVVRITKGDGGPMNLKIDRINHPGIVADLVEVRAGLVYELHINLHPPIRQTKLRAPIWLSTGVKEKPKISVLVNATIPTAWGQLSSN